MDPRVRNVHGPMMNRSIRFQVLMAVPIDGFDDLAIGDRDVMRIDAHKLPTSPYFLCVTHPDSSSLCHELF